jgi:hypothetical protein
VPFLGGFQADGVHKMIQGLNDGGNADSFRPSPRRAASKGHSGGMRVCTPLLSSPVLQGLQVQLAGGEGTFGRGVAEAHQGVQEGQLPWLIQRQTRNAPVVGKNLGLA